jgi:hypothetical protein
MFKNIKRNPKRIRKVSGRVRSSALASMTPQGEAVYCNRNIKNAYGYQK